MSIFQIPQKLGEIQKLGSEAERKKALADLASELELVPEGSESIPSSEAEWAAYLRKIHKDLLNRLLAIFGFCLILVSGMVAVWRSF